MIKRRISSGLLGIAILCFFLSWITVSCSGQKLFSLSGVDLVVRKKIDISDSFSTKVKKKETVRDWRAGVTFLLAIAGIGIEFLVKVNKIKK